MKRRNIIKGFTLLPFAGGVFGQYYSHLICCCSPEGTRETFFAELGLRTFINAAGTYTAMTASLMRKK
jgi:L-seryl-tRNA(Ser) seleniumtransferase